MKKGNYGISLSVFAVLCIIFAILRQPLAVLLIAGFAIIAEKDARLNKSVLATIIVMIVDTVVRSIVNGLFASLFTLATTPRVARAMSVFNNITNGFFFLVFLVVYIILAISFIKGKDLKLSFVDKLVSKQEDTDENTK